MILAFVVVVLAVLLYGLRLKEIKADEAQYVAAGRGIRDGTGYSCNFWGYTAFRFCRPPVFPFILALCNVSARWSRFVSALFAGIVVVMLIKIVPGNQFIIAAVATIYLLPIASRQYMADMTLILFLVLALAVSRIPAASGLSVAAALLTHKSGMFYAVVPAIKNLVEWKFAAAVLVPLALWSVVVWKNTGVFSTSTFDVWQQFQGQIFGLIKARGNPKRFYDEAVARWSWYYEKTRGMTDKERIKFTLSAVKNELPTIRLKDVLITIPIHAAYTLFSSSNEWFSYIYINANKWALRGIYLTNGCIVLGGLVLCWNEYPAYCIGWLLVFLGTYICGPVGSLKLFGTALPSICLFYSSVFSFAINTFAYWR